MKMEVHLLALRNAYFEMGVEGERPQLNGTPSIVSVDEVAA